MYKNVSGCRFTANNWPALFIRLAAAGVQAENHTVPGASGPNVRSGLLREEITVTARKREEALQDAPISITALTAEALRVKNIRDAYDVANNTPNFSFTQNLGRRLDVPIIRGQFAPLIGSTAPNTGFFVDGVYVAGSIGSTSTANLERVDVLRGPQSTLRGRNALAGVILVETAEPTYSWEGRVRSSIASFPEGESRPDGIDQWDAAFALSGPVVADQLAFRIAGELARDEHGIRDRIRIPTKFLAQAVLQFVQRFHPTDRRHVNSNRLIGIPLVHLDFLHAAIAQFVFEAAEQPQSAQICKRIFKNL